MGTRSTTKIYAVFGKEKQLLLALYKQLDGYHDGWGSQLKEFVNNCSFGNGIPMEIPADKVFCNGAGDFALQLVLKYKEGAGSIYATTEDDEQEYNYRIELIYRENTMEISEVHLLCDRRGYDIIYTVVDGLAVIKNDNKTKAD